MRARELANPVDALDTEFALAPRLVSLALRLVSTPWRKRECRPKRVDGRMIV